MEVQFGQVQATLLSLLPVGVLSDPVELVPLEPTVPEGGILAAAWGVLLTICHLVGSFGSCWIWAVAEIGEIEQWWNWII